MQVYNINYKKMKLNTGEIAYTVYDVNFEVATKELALQLFRILVEKIRRNHLNEAISIHECLGVDPCDFEYEDEYYTFQLITNDYQYEIDIDDSRVFETAEEVMKFYTIFDDKED